MVQPLDIVRFRYEKRLEDPAQPENIVIDNSDWVLSGTMASAQAHDFLQPYLSPGPDLLGGTSRGISEEIAQEGLEASLTVVEPEAISFRSQGNPFKPGRQARAIFEVASQEYDLSITDGTVAPRIKQAGDGTYSAAELGFPDLPHTVLTVSLAESFNGTHWKLVAAVQFLP